MAYNIGLNVIEVDGAGAPAIVGAAVSVGAFNILTARASPTVPRASRVTSSSPSSSGDPSPAVSAPTW